MLPLPPDVRIAARSLVRAPAFSAAMIATIALAIGANTAVFSVANAVLLRPLPFDHAGRLVWIASVTAEQPNYAFSLPEFLDYREQTRSLDALVAYAGWSAVVAGHGPTERLQGVRISSDAFDVLGVTAAAGRLLTPADDEPGAARVALVSFATWQRRFGGTPDAIGRVALLNGEPFEIVGVLPQQFPLPLPVEIAVPLAPDRDPARTLRRSTNSLRVIGRLRAGVTIDQAQSELAGIAARLRAQYPDAYGTKTGVAVQSLHAYLVRNHARGLSLLMLAVGAALLVACGNLVNLLLARAAARSSDVRIRLALGARPLDIVRTIWVETMLLSSAGGLLGVAAGWWTLRAFIRFGPADVPRLDEVALDGQALGFAMLLMLAVATVLAVAPAWQLARNRPSLGPGQARGAVSAGGRLRQAVVVAEMALTLVLLLGSVMLVRSFNRLQAVDPGFPVENRVVARIALPRRSYGSPAAIVRFAERFHASLSALPGVAAAGGVNVAPLSGVLATVDFFVDTAAPLTPGEARAANFRVVTDTYLPALGVPLLRGRSFTPADREESVPVALVSRHLAHSVFAGADPIGRRLLVNDNTAGFRPLQIVGVVGDVRHMTLDGQPAFDVYVPMRQAHPDVAQWLANNQFWVLTLHGPVPDDIASGVRRALEATDPSVGLAHVRPLDEYVYAAVAQRRFGAILSSALAAIAVALVVVGLYGVMAYSVAQRTREIGVRAAVGATRAAVCWLIARGALGLLALGTAAGLLLAVPLLAPLEAVLFRTSLFDPGLVAAAIAGLTAIGLAAAAVPAWRASRIDPVVALRE